MLDCTDPFYLDLAKDLSFTEEKVRLLNDMPIPHHVAIMMDGNRRWAQKQFSSKKNDPFVGHWAGAKCIFAVVEAAKEIGIKVLTLWAFSTENWKRSPLEVQLLMHIFEQYLRDMSSKMVEKGVKLSVIGDLAPLSEGIKNQIALTEEATMGGREIELVIAFNYGGKDDLKRAFLKITEKLENKEITKEAIDENLIAGYLDTAKWPDPDLIIRTSGENRVSNFMLWQLAYSEIYVTELLWPDFRPVHLVEAVINYQGRQRRRGG